MSVQVGMGIIKRSRILVILRSKSPLLVSTIINAA
jgi:hypothetical protein